MSKNYIIMIMIMITTTNIIMIFLRLLLFVGHCPRVAAYHTSLWTDHWGRLCYWLPG